MKELKKARMGMIAVMAVMLASITRRLTGTRRLSSGITTLALAGIVLLVAAGSASAATPITDCQDITASGEYYLANDINNSTADVCIYIKADDVILDGRGYYINGVAPGTCSAHSDFTSQTNGYARPGIAVKGQTNVTIKNVEVKNFCTGILLYGSSTKTEEHTIENCTVHDNGNPTVGVSTADIQGIALYKSICNSTVDNNQVYNNTGKLESDCDDNGAGIILKSGCKYNNITNNLAYNNTLAGIYSKKGGGDCYNYIAYNNVHENGQTGASASFTGGIRFQCKSTDDNTFEYNIVTDNIGPGIFIGGHDCILRHNIASCNKDAKASGNSRGDGLRVDRWTSDNGGKNTTLYNNTFCNNEHLDINVENIGQNVTGDHNICLTGTIGTYNDNSAPAGKVCEFDCPEEPDLIIEIISETRLSDTTYKVSYTVKNIGNATASSGHNTTLIVDGDVKERKEVPVSLGPCDTYTDTFDAVIGCTPETDNITVCADDYNVVSECREDNNCKTKIFPCRPVLMPDLVIQDKSEAWINETHYNVSYKVCNIGLGSADASKACIYIDTAHQAGKDVDVVALAAGACTAVITVGDFEYTPDTDNITVCADNYNVVDESDETNNCETNWLTCRKPDLTITNVDTVWVDQAAGTYNIIYTLENIGNKTAPTSRTTININGGSMNPPPDDAPALAPGAKLTDRQFPGLRTISGPGDCDSIVLYADKAHSPPGDILEWNENNNVGQDTICKSGLTIYVDPASLNITPQDQFDINIKVDPAGVEVYGVEYYLTYNTGVLRAESQVKGPFLGTTSETIVVVNAIDRGAGIVSYAETRKEATGVNVEGISSVIQFTAIGNAGECTDLDLYGVIIVDTSGGQVSAIIVDGEVCLTNNQPPVAAGCTKHLHNNVQKKFECLAQLCSSSTDPDGDDIVYIRWSFGDGEYGTSEGLGVCPCKFHSYTSWIWEPFGDPNGDYVPFNASLTVTDNGDPQLEDTTYIDVNVYLAGDANADGTVNILDAVLIGLTWDNECTGADCCELLWTGNEMADKADLNNDCKINILDAVIVGTMWDHNAYYPV